MRFLKIFGISIAAALSLASCAKMELSPAAADSSQPFFLFADTDGTRTANDGFSTKWAEGDHIALFCTETGLSSYSGPDDFSLTSDPSGKGGFSGLLSRVLDEDAYYDWYVLYPYVSVGSVMESVVAIGGGENGMSPQVQNGNSSTAHLAGADFPLYGRALAVAGDERVSVTMSQAVAVAKFVVTNDTDEPLTVSDVSLTAAEKIVGLFKMDISKETASFKIGDVNSTTAALSVVDGEEIAPGGSADFYVAFKPFTAKAGSVLKISVNGYSKDLHIPDGGNVVFAPGTIKQIRFSYDKSSDPPVVDDVTYVLDFPDDNSASNKVGAYDRAWTATKGALSWTISAFNNNYWNNSWTSIKAGRKSGNGATAPYIATTTPLPAAIRTVTVTYGKVTNLDKIRSATLTVAGNADFTQNASTYPLDVVNGEAVTVSLNNPASGLYYMISYSLGEGSGNGFLEIVSVSYSTKGSSIVDPVDPDDPPISGWLELPAISGNEDYVGTFYSGSNRNYTYNYEYSSYTSLWVAYPLYSATTGGSRSGSWARNPVLSDSYQVNIWSGSYGVNVGATIYARGHQIPDADRSNESTMQSQTYYATNSTPQIQNKFNDGIWSKLETDVRGAIPSGDTLYVVTGASFNKIGESRSVARINPKHDPDKSVPVPNYYWKALLKVKRSGNSITSASAVGVWLEHRQYDNSSYTSYTVSVDQIEAWTGFDLFTALPDAKESSAETNSSWTVFSDF